MRRNVEKLLQLPNLGRGNGHPTGDAASLRAAEAEHDLDVMRIALDLAHCEIAALREHNTELIRSTAFTQAVLDETPPLLILDSDLRVVLANSSFLSHFRVAQPETEKCLVYELGNSQWDIPRLRLLLEEVLPRNSFFEDFEITHTFPEIGERTILLSGRRVDHLERILLNLEDVTERLHFQSAMRRSERRYRRLFEAAQDGIFIVDAVTRKITDCNPFLLRCSVVAGRIF